MTHKSDDPALRLNLRFSDLIGLKCQRANSGTSNGSRLLIHFGEIIDRKWVHVFDVPKEIITYEYNVFVMDSCWKLEEKKLLLCNQDSDSSLGGPLSVHPARLINQTVFNVIFNISQPWDVILEFENDFRLTVLAKRYCLDKKEPIYRLKTPEGRANIFEDRITFDF